jgi:hypothetical protein
VDGVHGAAGGAVNFSREESMTSDVLAFIAEMSAVAIVAVALAIVGDRRPRRR